MEPILAKATNGMSSDEISWLNKTILNGKMTVKQLLIIIAVAIIVVLVLSLIKKGIKFIIVGALVIYACIHFGLISPAQMGDIGKQLAAEGIAKYQEYAGASDNIRVVTVDKKTGEKGIEINLLDNWVNIDDIDSIVNGKKEMTVNINGQSYTVNDPKVIEMLKTFTDGNFIQKIFKVFG